MTRGYPVRLIEMSDTQKMNRIIDLENALQQTNDRIAAAVAEEREQCAKVAESVKNNTYYAPGIIADMIRARNGAGK